MSRDLPIIFSGPMVLALLREVEQPGTGKTQTRRLATRWAEFGSAPQEFWQHADFTRARPDGLTEAVRYLHVPCHVDEPGTCAECDRRGWDGTAHRLWPKVQPGDRLYVREKWQLHSRAGDLVTVVYGATLKRSWTETHEQFPARLAEGIPAVPFQMRLRPSIHHPRWASRLTLPVTGVKIERLQDISEEDALAEGVQAHTGQLSGCFSIAGAMSGTTARECFERLWKSIHPEKIRVKAADGSSELRDNPARWDANPFVVATSFTPIKTNIDQLPKQEAA